MNWEQLRAILWLRQRLSFNQWRKAGAVNFVLMVIFYVSMISFAALAFFLTLGLGVFLLPKASPTVVLITWDVAIVILLFSWATALLIDIQRMELLSLDRFLHLPMSLRDAFLMNYLSSLMSLNMACFVPAAFGLCIASAVVHGPRLLLLIPVLFSFILALTALTYQFRGWLSAWMIDKRRQRTAITLITIGFVGLTQIPTIIVQLSKPEGDNRQRQLIQEHNAEATALMNSLFEQEIPQEERDRRMEELKKSHIVKLEQVRKMRSDAWHRKLVLINQILPAAWLPYASYTLVEHSWWPSLLICGVMLLVGGASLWRSYQSTIRFYTGQLSPQSRKASVVDPSPTNKTHDRTNQGAASANMLERKLPLISENASAVAMLSFRVLVRSPEAKMMLIGPGIFAIMFTVLALGNRLPKIPDAYHGLVWLGGVSVVMFMLMMLTMNIFGLDRSGFRCFVLMPVRRQNILMGKNLAMLPVCASMIAFVCGALSYMAPVNATHALASICQMLITFFCASTIGNWVSLFFPFAVTPGTGKPVQVNFTMVLAQLVAMFLGPIVVLPGLLLYGIEWSLSGVTYISEVPLFLLFSMLEMAIVIWGYLYLLRSQGEILQAHETRILERLAANNE